MTAPKAHRHSRNRKKPETLAAIDSSLGVSLGAHEERSIFNMVPMKMREAIERLDPVTLTWPESRLEAAASPDETDHALRLNFWAEYYRAMDLSLDTAKPVVRMELYAILRNVSHYPYFKANYLENPAKLAWLLSAPKSLAVQQEETLYQAMKRLRDVIRTAEVYDVIEVEKTNARGQVVDRRIERKFNHRAAESITKIAELMANRVQGSIVNRHALLTSQVPPPANTQPEPPALPGRDAIEGRLKEISESIDAEEVEDF